MECFLPDETATLVLGSRLAAQITPGMVIFLKGDLGAGKTTLVRGFLQALGHKGAVKSPTYALVEPYELDIAGTPCAVFHFDLYRLADPEELEYLGGRDYFSSESVCLIEWPEKGAGWLPPADLVVSLQPSGAGRQARLLASSPCGEAVLEALKPLLPDAS